MFKFIVTTLVLLFVLAINSFADDNNKHEKQSNSQVISIVDDDVGNIFVPQKMIIVADKGRDVDLCNQKHILYLDLLNYYLPPNVCAEFKKQIKRLSFN